MICRCSFLLRTHRFSDQLSQMAKTDIEPTCEILQMLDIFGNSKYCLLQIKLGNHCYSVYLIWSPSYGNKSTSSRCVRVPNSAESERRPVGIKITNYALHYSSVPIQIHHSWPIITNCTWMNEEDCNVFHHTIWNASNSGFSIRTWILISTSYRNRPSCLAISWKTMALIPWQTERTLTVRSETSTAYIWAPLWQSLLGATTNPQVKQITTLTNQPKFCGFISALQPTSFCWRAQNSAAISQHHLPKAVIKGKLWQINYTVIS